MKEYVVYGTVEMNWALRVKAESEDEAEEFAKDAVHENSCEWTGLVDEPEITEIKRAPKENKGKHKN